jgi:hypothetical protein
MSRDITVIPFRQPEAIDDPLTEVAREGAGLAVEARCPRPRLNEHIEADGPTVFAHACKMGLEGIVSKRKTSRSQWPLTGLDQEQEPGVRGGEAGRGRELGPMIEGKTGGPRRT